MDLLLTHVLKSVMAQDISYNNILFVLYLAVQYVNIDFYLCYPVTWIAKMIFISYF
jgi:hypothetical protein